MLKSARIWLVLVALLASLLMAACGGDENGEDENGGEPAATVPADEDEEGNEAEATATVSDGDEATDEGGNGGGDGGEEAFSDVPVPSGADETGSGSFNASDLALLAPGADVDTEAFTNIEYKQYEVDDSPEAVIDFYRDALGDWEEVFVFSGGAAEDEGGFGVWTTDDGAKGVWIITSAVDDKTELMVVMGAQE